MICETACRDCPMLCREDDGTPVPSDDPRVVNLLQAAHPAPEPPPIDQNGLAARASACKACEYRRTDTDRCSLMSCGCALTQRQKSPYASCPACRWPSPLPSVIPG